MPGAVFSVLKISFKKKTVLFEICEKSGPVCVFVDIPLKCQKQNGLFAVFAIAHVFMLIFTISQFYDFIIHDFV